MDWQTTAAIIASIGALLVSLYTAKSAVRKGDVEALSIIIGQLRKRIEELQAQLTEYKQKIHDLEEQLAHQFARYEQKTERLELELSEYKQKYQDLKNEYDRIQKLYVRMCAFVRRLGFDPEAIDEEEPRGTDGQGQ